MEDRSEREKEIVRKKRERERERKREREKGNVRKKREKHYVALMYWVNLLSSRPFVRSTLCRVDLLSLCLVKYLNIRLGTWSRFVEQKLVLSSSFRCDRIHNCYRYDFGHTFLCYLSQTWMFKKTSEALGVSHHELLHSGRLCKWYAAWKKQRDKLSSLFLPKTPATKINVS